MSLDLERDAGNYRYGPSAERKLSFCIEQLERADGFENSLDWKSEIVEGLTVEELVGTILHANDEIGVAIE